MNEHATVCVDFDGVIHQYTSWDGNPPQGKPVEGIKTGLFILNAAGYRVVVFTARQASYVRDWMREHGLLDLVDDVTNQKIPAVAYFDDRAWHVASNMKDGLRASAEAFLRRHAIIPGV